MVTDWFREVEEPKEESIQDYVYSFNDEIDKMACKLSEVLEDFKNKRRASETLQDVTPYTKQDLLDFGTFVHNKRFSNFATGSDYFDAWTEKKKKDSSKHKHHYCDALGYLKFNFK